VILLDSSYSLTKGNPVSLSSIMSYFDPAMGIFTGVQKTESGEIGSIGQFHYNVGDCIARLSYIIPSKSCNLSDLICLLDGLTQEAGRQGFYTILTEINETDPLFKTFRRCGFSVYARQQIWELPPKISDGINTDSVWQNASNRHLHDINTLIKNLVPPIVQSAELGQRAQKFGLVYYKNDLLLAYIEKKVGLQGVYLIPLFHPDVDDTSVLLLDIISHLPLIPKRPVYMAVRSYQSGIEYSLEKINCKKTPTQALLVKHLTSFSKVSELSKRQSVLENVRAEPTVSIVTGQQKH